MNTTLVYWLPDAPSIMKKKIDSFGASIRDVAREAGVNYCTIYYILNGRTKRSLRENAESIANVLQLDLKTLIKGF